MCWINIHMYALIYSMHHAMFIDMKYVFFHVYKIFSYEYMNENGKYFMRMIVL